MKHTTASLLLLARSALGFFYAPEDTVGVGPRPFFAERNRTPNITKSVEFKPFGSGDGTWRWSVNITEVQVDDAETPPGLSPPEYTADDAKVLNTVYSFSWDQDDEGDSSVDGNPASLATELDDQNARFSNPVCVSPISAYAYFPPNVTNLFNESIDASGPCAQALGQSCIDGIRDQYLSLPINNRTGCRGTFAEDLMITAIPQCQGNFPDRPYLFTWNFPLNNMTGNANGTLSGTNMTYENGNAFKYSSTLSYNGSDPDNDAYYDSEQFRVHMILFDGGVDDSFNALCMRVNTSVVATDDPSTGAESAGSAVGASIWLGGLTAVIAMMSVL